MGFMYPFLLLTSAKDASRRILDFFREGFQIFSDLGKDFVFQGIDAALRIEDHRFHLF